MSSKNSISCQINGIYFKFCSVTIAFLLSDLISLTVSQNCLPPNIYWSCIPHEAGDLRNILGSWAVPCNKYDSTYSSVSQRAQTGADEKCMIFICGPCRPSNQKSEVLSCLRSPLGTMIISRRTGHCPGFPLPFSGRIGLSPIIVPRAL